MMHEACMRIYAAFSRYHLIVFRSVIREGHNQGQGAVQPYYVRVGLVVVMVLLRPRGAVRSKLDRHIYDLTWIGTK